MALIDDISSAAAVAGSALFMGSTPTQARYDSLTAFSKGQFQSYTALGVGNPSLGPFEALGKAFAADPSTKGTFATYFGGGSTEFFVNSAYDYVYDSGPSAAAAASLVSQVNYFTNLYKGAGIPTADAALQARGAVMGQIIGYAFTDAAAASHTLIDDVVHSLVAAANRGDFSGFGKALAGFPLPVPVNFVVPTSAIEDFTFNSKVAEVFVANPAYYGNQITGFIVGQDKIDLTNFDFALNVRPAAITAPGPEGHFFLSNGVSYAAVINTGMLFLDVDGNGDFKGATDVSIQLVGTQGNPSGADLIF
jgi:hypothetical protein